MAHSRSALALAIFLATMNLGAHPQAVPSGPHPSRKLQFERGKELLEQGKFAEAAAEFRELQKSIPDSPLLYNLLGLCYLQQGRHDEAVADFKKAIALKPDFKAAHNNLGGIYLLQGRAQDAVNEFSTVIRIDPKDAQAFYNLARAEFAVKQKEAGIEHLRKAYDLSPGNLPVALALAQAYLEAGQKELGRPIAQKLGQAAVSDASSQLQLGNLLLNYGLEDVSLEHFRNAQRTDPKARETLYALAADNFKKQNYKATLKLLESVKPAMQNSAAWHELGGESSFKLGDPALAVVELQKAMELDPHNEDYVLELGEVFVSQNNAPEAVTLFEAAVKSFPNSPRIWYGLGVAYLAEVHYSSAETALRTSLKLDPTLDLAYVVLGQGYEEAGQWDQLRKTASQLIDLNPKNAMGYYYQAMALLRSGPLAETNEKEIETLLRKSMDLSDHDPKPHYELAKLLVQEGRREAALLEFEKITQTNPDFGPAHYQLYRLYRERGELEKSEAEKLTHERISAEERKKAMTKLLVEVHQRPTR